MKVLSRVKGAPAAAVPEWQPREPGCRPAPLRSQGRRAGQEADSPAAPRARSFLGWGGRPWATGPAPLPTSRCLALPRREGRGEKGAGGVGSARVWGLGGLPTRHPAHKGSSLLTWREWPGRGRALRILVRSAAALCSLHSCHLGTPSFSINTAAVWERLPAAGPRAQTSPSAAPWRLPSPPRPHLPGREGSARLRSARRGAEARPRSLGGSAAPGARRGAGEAGRGAARGRSGGRGGRRRGLRGGWPS